MQKKKKKNSGSSTGVIVTVVILALAVVSLFGYIVYKNIFAGVESKRYEGIENYKITVDETNGIKEVFEGLEQVEKIDVYTASNKNSKSRIIKVRIVLKDDVDFDKMKELCNSAIEKVTEENLSFYDMEVFISSNNAESEVYPQIGYKHRSNSSFSW